MKTKKNTTKKMLTNEIARLKKKLKVFETKGLSVVVEDLLLYVSNSNWDGSISPEQLLRDLKTHYQRQLEDHLQSKQKFKQTKLKL